jgi:hypothetical protein
MIIEEFTHSDYTVTSVCGEVHVHAEGVSVVCSE